MERLPKRTEVMASNGVHNLVKDTLDLTKGKDIVDAYNDIKLVEKVLQREMLVALGELPPELDEPAPRRPGPSPDECNHTFRWNGKLPCTGVYACVHCGRTPSQVNEAAITAHIDEQTFWPEDNEHQD